MHDTRRKRIGGNCNVWRREPSQWQPVRRKKSIASQPRKRFKKLDDGEAETRRLKAVKRHVLNNVLMRDRKRQLAKLLSGLAFDDRHQLAALNPHAGTLFAGYLDQAIQQIRSNLPVHAVTLISPKFNVDWDGRWPKLDEVRCWIDRWLCGFPHLMLIQVGFRRIAHIVWDESGHRHYTYRHLMCLHTHGLVWGDEEDVELRLEQMPRSLRAPGGHCQPLTLAYRWLEYSAADPRHIETRRKRWLALGYAAGAMNISLKLEAKLVGYLHGVTKPDLCVAAGLGEKVLKHAVRKAMAKGYSDHG